MYLRYIYKLHDLHLQADNFTEAGFTMKLYADQLSWSSTTVVSDNNFAGQQEFRVKEQLYHKIIHYFDKGKVIISQTIFCYKYQNKCTFRVGKKVFPCVKNWQHFTKHNYSTIQH